LLEEVPGLNICEVNVTFSHEGEEDLVQVQTWLPLHEWNDRVLAVGGSAWAAGFGTANLAIPAKQGYAVSSTDAGLPLNPYSPEAWALKQDGSVDIGLLTNFAHRSVHDMAVVGKAVTEAFYRQPAKYSFFNGCSTGGRQALAAAQRYPEDFDGILSGSPAIHWTEYVIAELWPQVVMYEHGKYLSQCEMGVFVQAAIEACDNLDGVTDGVINDPAKCLFDPQQLVGKVFDCSNQGQRVTITREAATIVSKIWIGPQTAGGEQLWHGLFKGASLVALSGSTQVNGTTVGAPFLVADTWVRFFVEQNPELSLVQIDQGTFVNLFYKSKTKFDELIGSANPDLQAFRDAGGKLMITHGLADDLIYPQGSIQYVEEVQSALGRPVDDFMRLFLSPGVDHCATAASYGAVPTDPFGALIQWVEQGSAPFELAAHTSETNPAQFARKICPYPEVARYRGYGDPTVAESYVC
jgi:pimeloyl-ACP methyl ester carboxylesterase